MDKKLLLFDNGKQIKDSVSNKPFIKGEVIVRDADTKHVKFRGFNKVIVSGSAFTASKLFNIKPRVFTPSYNTVLGLDNSVNVPYEGEGIRKEEQVFLFAVGIGGCGEQSSQVFNVDYTKWIQPEELIPFRYQLPSNDLSGHLRDKYFGRKSTDERIAYYFKAFENPPELEQRYTDGTPIDENIYLSERIDEVETYVRLNLKITKEDCRDFFLATTGINTARFDTISILTAYKTEYEGYEYYQDIRPLTKININAESLVDISKAVEIEYLLYF